MVTKTPAGADFKRLRDALVQRAASPEKFFVRYDFYTGENHRRQITPLQSRAGSFRMKRGPAKFYSPASDFVG